LLSTRGPAVANVTREKVDGYIAELKVRVSSVTVYGSISKLRLASELICPARDFTWLSEIEKDLRFEMRPRSKFDRLVLAHVLVGAGMTLITEAEMATTLTELARALQVRNGVMLALLALCPIRPKDFIALDIGSTFVQIRGQWWIVLTASQTTTYRPVLAHGTSSSALWLSSKNGQPMQGSGFRHMIKSTTLSTVGVALSPHMFRTCAASTAAMHGENPCFLLNIEKRSLPWFTLSGVGLASKNAM
jgi:hypothetical protein